MRFEDDCDNPSEPCRWLSSYGFRIHALECEYFKIDHHWDAKDVCSNFWRLYVNNRDSAWLQLDRQKRYVLSAHTLHLVPAWVRFNCHNDRELDHFYIHFELIGLPGAILRQIFSQPIALGSTRRFQSLLKPLRCRPWQRGDDPLAVYCQIQALLYCVFAEAQQKLSPEHAALCQPFMYGTSAMAQVLQHIEQHLDEPLRNASLARICYLSRDHFVRRFHQQVGQTPTQYIRERRVARAAQKLLLGDESIEDIARQTGFGDRFYFTRVFRQIMGVTPASYRRTEHNLRQS